MGEETIRCNWTLFIFYIVFVWCLFIVRFSRLAIRAQHFFSLFTRIINVIFAKGKAHEPKRWSERRSANFTNKRNRNANRWLKAKPWKSVIYQFLCGHLHPCFLPIARRLHGLNNVSFGRKSTGKAIYWNCLNAFCLSADTLNQSETN